MRIEDYHKAYNYKFSQGQTDGILLEVLILLSKAEPILFKDGKWNPLKKRSIKRWIQLGMLAIGFIKVIIKICRK